MRPSAQEVRDRHFGKLKPCPFCGASADILTVDAGENHGGMYVQCNNDACMACSTLIFPVKEDVHLFLIERWNRRTGQ